MKRLSQVVLSLLLVALVAAGCGVPQEDYDQVVSDLAAAQAEITRLQTELAAVKEQNSSLQTELDAVNAAHAELNALVDEKVGEIESAKPYKDILVQLLLPAITGDALAEEGTINAVERFVGQTGDGDLQGAFDAWKKNPRNKSLASQVLGLALLKLEELVFG